MARNAIKGAVVALSGLVAGGGGLPAGLTVVGGLAVPNVASAVVTPADFGPSRDAPTISARELRERFAGAAAMSRAASGAADAAAKECASVSSGTPVTDAAPKTGDAKSQTDKITSLRAQAAEMLKGRGLGGLMPTEGEAEQNPNYQNTKAKAEDATRTGLKGKLDGILGAYLDPAQAACIDRVNQAESRDERRDSNIFPVMGDVKQALDYLGKKDMGGRVIKVINIAVGSHGERVNVVDGVEPGQTWQDPNGRGGNAFFKVAPIEAVAALVRDNALYGQYLTKPALREQIINELSQQNQAGWQRKIARAEETGQTTQQAR